MPQITPNDIHNIHDFDALLDFFREKLDWRIPEDVELEDVTFPWSTEDLDLDEPTEDRIVECRQLPPFPSSQPTLGLIDDTQPWGIFFLQFNSESIYRTALRRVLRGLANRRNRDASLPAWEHENLLFICTTTDFQHFAFAHFAAKENWRCAVLSIFSWEQGDTHIPSLCKYNLPALALPHDGFPNDEAWLKAWQEAFDVEAVTDQFFQDYQRVFARVENAVDGIPDNDTETKRLWTQRLFNRLMFLRFIEKKGWLSYNGNRDYLRALFEASEAETDENFLNDRLYWAFFHGLGSASDSAEESAAAIERRGEVPFLNGGLFEMQEYDERNVVHIPNDKFAEILNLFERYNFTVTESTPFDIEVAVDPEMLGKVFEELVTGRHDTGSYYTPRPVVSFMCRESLKICLQNKTDETPETLQKFIDDGEATEIRNPEPVLKVLQTLSICDPACGSGAYLLGMMSELLRLREALFQSNQIDSPTIYQRKFDIIQNNLYGVDKDEFAVNIAMLRLWLSLAVDYEGDTPQPLPNLDYKVAVGDSLTGPAPEPANEQIRPEDYLIQQISEHQAEYQVTYTDPEKHRLRETIAELKRLIHGWQENPEGFIWQVEFQEVFQEGGFDIVIGNPPYVDQRRIRMLKPILKKLFPEVYSGTADLYVYFYKRGIELLRTGGSLTYISSNTFLHVEFGKKLRVFFTDKVCLHRLLNFGSVPVFKAAVDTCIFLVENTVPNREVFLVATFRDKTDIPRLYEAFEKHAFPIHVNDFSPDGWVLTSPETLSLLNRLQKMGTPLGEYMNWNFYRGLTTGCNEAFVISDSVRQRLIAEDASSIELIKPSLRGRTLKDGKWKLNSVDEYIIVITSSANNEWPWSDTTDESEAERIFSNTYPSIYQHLIGYRDKLITRDDRGKFYWELRSCAYYAEFEKPKIIYPHFAKYLYAFYDTAEVYGVNTIYFIPTNDLSILAILCSKLFDWYARHKFQTLQDPWAGGSLLFKKVSMEKVPIADRTAAQKAQLSELVEQILADPNSDRVPDIEREIDEYVYNLYGVTDQEKQLIKQTYQDNGMKV